MKFIGLKLGFFLVALSSSHLVFANETETVDKKQINKCMSVLIQKDKVFQYQKSFARIEELSLQSSSLEDGISVNMQKAFELKKKILEAKEAITTHKYKLSTYFSPITLPFYFYSHKKLVSENNKLRDELSHINKLINKIESNNRSSLELILIDNYENYKFHMLSERNTAIDASHIHSAYLGFIETVKDKSVDYLEELTYFQTESPKKTKGTYFFLNSYINEKGDTVYFVESKINEFIVDIIEKGDNLEKLLSSLPKSFAEKIKRFGEAYFELYYAIDLNQEGYIGLDPLLVEKYFEQLKIVADAHNKNLHQAILKLSNDKITSHHINSNLLVYGLVYVTYLNIHGTLNGYNQNQHEIMAQIYKDFTAEIVNTNSKN